MTEKRTVEIPATFVPETLEPINEDDLSTPTIIRKNQQAWDQHHPIVPGSPVTTEQLAVEIYDQWASKDIVCVQPMNDPIGLVYFLAYMSAKTRKAFYIGKDEPDLQVISRAAEVGSVSYKTNDGYIDIAQVVDELGTSGSSVYLAEFINACANEIDTEIVGDLRQLATKRTTKLGKHGSDAMLIAMMRSAKDIAVATKRGAGNHFIFGKKAYDTFFGNEEQDSDFNSTRALNKAKAGWNFGYNGSLCGASSYTSNVLADNEILVSYKGGSGECDSNYFYCPYMMLTSKGNGIDPSTFKPTAGKFYRRYDKVVIAQDYLEDAAPNESTYQHLIIVEDL